MPFRVSALCSCRGSPAPRCAHDAPALIRRGDPEQYQLGPVTRGPAWYAQGGSETEPRAGDLVPWDTSRPYDSGSGLDGGGVEVLVLQIPEERLPLAALQVDRLIARRMDSTTGMKAVLTQFLGAMAKNGSECRPRDLGSLGSVAVEPTAAYLVQQLGAEPQLPEAALAHVLLRQIDALIEQNLADLDPTPRTIAERHHISLRSLYTLFQDHVDGQGRSEGVAEAIRRRRLERCRADPAGRSRGGFTTKPRPAVEQGQKPMPTVVTAGRRGARRSSKRHRRRPACPASGRTGRRVSTRSTTASASGRVRNQPPQAPPGRGHAPRQARSPLRSRCPRRGRQRVAVISTRRYGSWSWPAPPHECREDLRVTALHSLLVPAPRTRSARDRPDPADVAPVRTHLLPSIIAP
ncbi:hypothetical protein ACFYXP_32030 [Streptomyces sp. NPDC002466]